MRPRVRSYGESSTRTLSPGKDADEVFSHLAGDMGKHLVLVLQLDLKHSVGQGLQDRPRHFDRFFLRHNFLCRPWCCALRSSSYSPNQTTPSFFLIFLKPTAHSPSPRSNSRSARPAPVHRPRRPTVGVGTHVLQHPVRPGPVEPGPQLRADLTEHRLDGQDHPLPQLEPAPALAEVVVPAAPRASGGRCRDRRRSG